jgi:hypothetical protein
MSEESALDTGTDQGTEATEVSQEQGGENQSHWADALPEEYRESMKGYDSFEALQDALKGPQAPEEYTAPEGVEIDSTTFEAFAPVAKEAGLTQEQVNALVKFDVERMGNLTEKLREQADAQMQEGLKQMASEMGKEKYDEALRLANQTLKTFADEEVGKWLDESGMGNSPVLVKLLSKIGEKLSEDSPQGGVGGGEKTPEHILYPDMN